MKLTKKVFSIVLAMVMVLASVTSVWATGLAPNYDEYDGTIYRITIQNNNHDLAKSVYEAYQIFSGELAYASDDHGANADLILSNITWGNAISESEQESLLADLKASNSIFADCVTAADVAAALGENAGDNDELAQEFAEIVEKYLDPSDLAASYTMVQSDIRAVLDVNAPGYYLVRNTPPEGGSSENFAYTRYILQVVGEVTDVVPKADVPSVEKKVKDINDSTNKETGWQDSADYEIGDHIPFQLKATLPDNFADYETYYMAFHDTLSEGLTYDDGSVTFYVAKLDKDGNIGKEEEGGTEMKYQIRVPSFMTRKGANNTVEFYCRNLGKSFNSYDEDGYVDHTEEFFSDPDYDYVILVEYTATLNDSAIRGTNGNVNDVYLEYSNNPNAGGEGDHGTTPQDKVTVFTFDIDVNKVDQDNLPLAGAEFTLYKWDGTVNNWVEKALVKSEDGTTFSMDSLDDGYYMLEETVTPTGYNDIESIYFAVEAKHDVDSADPQLTSLTVKGLTVTGTGSDTEFTTADELEDFTVWLANGNISTDIINQRGAQLPETGGIGTTIFYVVGGILVVGAVILLVTKKRMSKEG